VVEAATVRGGWQAAGVARSSRLDQKALLAMLRAQDNVIARQQAADCGLTRDALAYRLRPDGSWQYLLPGTYLAVTGAPTAEQRDMAALLYAGPGSVITGLAALRGQGIRNHRNLRSPELGAIDVLIPGDRQRRSAGFVAVQRTGRMPERVIEVGRRRYAMVPRAVADAARGLADAREARALVAGIVQERRCPLGMLVRELNRGPVRNSAVLRQVLAEAAQGIRSVTEGDLLQLIKRSRLPMPMLNARLYAPDGTLIAVADAWWPESGVAGEVDSREWHLAPADWERTMRRHAEMSRQGIIVLHFSPRQIRSEPAAVAAAIDGALKAGAARSALPVTARAAS
jgi:hypothetical protein